MILINRDELIGHLNKKHYSMASRRDIYSMKPLEVINCEYCIYFGQKGYCLKTNFETKKDGFCHMAIRNVRREESAIDRC